MEFERFEGWKGLGRDGSERENEKQKKGSLASHPNSLTLNLETGDRNEFYYRRGIRGGLGMAEEESHFYITPQILWRYFAN